MGENFGLSSSYEYKELALDSLDADGSYIFGVNKTDWPVFSVAGKGPLEDVVAVKILEAVIPFSWDVFNTVNNTFIVSEVGMTTTLTFPVTIPVGNYTSLAIATAAGSGGQVFGPPIAAWLLGVLPWQSVFMIFAAATEGVPAA